jgi:hypothetical protein
MPAEKRIRLNDVKSLSPEFGASSRKNKKNQVTMCKLRHFYLAAQYNHLLAEDGIFCE